MAAHFPDLGFLQGLEDGLPLLRRRARVKRGAYRHALLFEEGCIEIAGSLQGSGDCLGNSGSGQGGIECIKGMALRRFLGNAL